MLRRCFSTLTGSLANPLGATKSLDSLFEKMHSNIESNDRSLEWVENLVRQYEGESFDGMNYAPVSDRVSVSDVANFQRSPTVFLDKMFSLPENIDDIPGLEHDLEDFVTNDAIFPRYLNERMPLIAQPHEVDFGKCAPFITASKDQTLIKLAASHGARFVGSTSSTTGLLAQAFMSLSKLKSAETHILGEPFDSMPHKFTASSCQPARVFMTRKAETLVIDSAKKDEVPSNQILMDLGRSLERMLTLKTDTFQRLMVKESLGEVEDPFPRSSYSFLKIGDFFVRSQQDCRISGTNRTFDLKTRAVHPIRHDVVNYSQHLNYRIFRNTGITHSFQREFYDMMRSAFLKYALQLRIGSMDGAFVLYHNTREIFGCQYVPLGVIEQCVFGSQFAAALYFDQCFKLLSVVLQKVISLAPPDFQHLALCLGYDKGDGVLFANVYSTRATSEDEFGSLWKNEVLYDQRSFVVETQSFVDGKLCHRSPPIKPDSQWDVFYKVSDISVEKGKEYNNRNSKFFGNAAPRRGGFKVK